MDKAVSGGGGGDKLLKLFQMRKRLLLGTTIQPTVETAMKRGGCVSVTEAPEFRWIGAKERGEVPAKFLAHGWTVGVLDDRKSKLEMLPGITVSGRLETKPTRPMRV